MDDAMYEMHVLDEQGRIQKGADAFTTMWDALPYFWAIVPFARLPPIHWAATKAYYWWAARRGAVSAALTASGGDAVPARFHNTPPGGGSEQACESTQRSSAGVGGSCRYTPRASNDNPPEDPTRSQQ
jgi:hypothetical protein